jgi:Tol biopolymer transport system component
MAKTKHFGPLAAAVGALVAMALLMLMLVVVNPQPAKAALPGDNGRIAYQSFEDGDWEIFTIGATGGLSSQLTFNNTTDSLPCYSPDGFRIGYLGSVPNNPPFNQSQIFTIPTTGGTPFQVTPNTAEPLECSFTGPRGDTIVYSGFDNPDFEIYTIPASGGTPSQLTNNFAPDDFSPSYTVIGKRTAYQSTSVGNDFEIFSISATEVTPFQVTNNTTADIHPDYRPDGGRIVYSSREEGPFGNPLDFEIFTISASGGTPTQLTFNNISEIDPVYSPDGRRIAYSSFELGDSEIFTISATGGTPFQVTNNTTEDSDPSWQPRP